MMDIEAAKPISISQDPGHLLAARSPEDPAIASLSDASAWDVDLEEKIQAALRGISNRIVGASAVSSVWFAPLLDVLANATREQPFWRPLFGHPAAAAEQPDGSPTCILDAARCIITAPSLREQDDILRPTLRLIANCCADDNVSRSVLVNADGIGHLKHLAFGGRALDLLLPTIYNVCVDYDEVAQDDHQQPLRQSDLDTTVELTKAEEALGQVLEDPEITKTAIELFLDLYVRRKEASLGFIADLAEMASRPAPFGVGHILGRDEQLWPLRSHRILSRLYMPGMHIMKEDEDTKPSILQTFLNVLSQKQFQIELVQAPHDLLLKITRLFSVVSEDDTALKRYADSFMQILYALSALPEFTETFAPKSNAFSSLVQQLEQLLATEGRPHPYHLASPIALLANSLTSPERVAQSLSQSPTLPKMVADIIRDTSYPITLIPALDLASRFALDHTGRSSLLSTDIFESLHRKLQPSPPAATQSTQSHTLTIHRECVSLTRLLLKSPSTPPTSSALILARKSPSFAPLDDTILALFSTALDDAIKLEIGRYSVELLRQATKQTTPSSPSPPTFTHLLSPLIHLLTASPSAPARAEAVFGLGLLLKSSAAANGDAAALSLAPLVAERKKVLAALEQVLDGADAARTGEEAERNEGVRIDGDESEIARDLGARRAQAEEENVKMVVVQLLRALKEGPHGAEEVQDGEAEFVDSLGALATRLRWQV